MPLSHFNIVFKCLYLNIMSRIVSPVTVKLEHQWNMKVQNIILHQTIRKGKLVSKLKLHNVLTSVLIHFTLYTSILVLIWIFYLCNNTFLICYLVLLSAINWMNTSSSAYFASLVNSFIDLNCCLYFLFGKYWSFQ